MRRFLSVLVIFLLLGGCSKAEESSDRTAGHLAGGGSSQNTDNLKLAYSHDITVEMAAKHIKARYERARDLCIKEPELHCILLNSSYNMGDPTRTTPPNARLSVRLPHNSIENFQQKMLSPLPDENIGDAFFSTQSTKADDLTKVIADTQQRYKQLLDYRARLTELAAREDAKVEDLVKIASELSTVQSQIEAITAKQKELDERITTELLSISFRARSDMISPFGPIAKAWKNSGRSLGDSAGSALQFTIKSLPWLPIIAFALYFIRLFFRRLRS